MRAGVDLAFETIEIVLCAFGLRMIFRICRDLDEKVVAEFLADEGNKFVGVVKVPCCCRA